MPTPYAPALKTASQIATATGIVANAVVQMMKPDMGEYAVKGTVNFFAKPLGDRIPALSPAINETANVINNSSASKEAQAIANKFLSRFLNQNRRWS
ncbi:Hemolysin [Pandoraea anapnoica]|uniref:Hemolysin n=1 Tax=Pandoraea anapnoica TaxID=2508301 RepID=A0A5E5AAH0_9BURK|nr:Hemolysin [Pandoraea anapnoica]